MDCIFCRIAAGQLPAEIVHEDEHAIAIQDINPQAPMHVLVIPRRHIATLNDLGEADRELVGHLHLVAARLAAGAGHAERGYRVLFNTGRAAGQSVWHIHLHVLAGRAMRWPPG